MNTPPMHYHLNHQCITSFFLLGMTMSTFSRTAVDLTERHRILHSPTHSAHCDLNHMTEFMEAPKSVCGTKRHVIVLLGSVLIAF